MKKTLLLLIAFIAIVHLQAQNNGVAISTSATATPDPSAILDVQSTDQGILIPRVDIADLSTAAPVSSPKTSLIVYNSNTTTGLGFFYWDGSAWVSIGGAKSINDLSDAKTGNSSVYLGSLSGSTSSGSYNVGVGLGVLSSVTGNDNTVVGYSAGALIDAGADNVVLGYSAGDNLSSGSNNIVIGTSVDASSATASNELNIGDAVYATGIYGSSAKVGVGNGNNAPSSTLDNNGSISMPLVTKTANYTANDNDYSIIYTHSSGTPTLTLPQASTCAGRIYIVKTVNSSLNVALSGSDQWEDGTTTNISMGATTGDIQIITFQSDGSGKWYMINFVKAL